MSNVTINKIELVGYIGEDIKVINFDDGNKLVQTSLATHEFFTKNKDDEPMQFTTWHRVIFKNKLADEVEPVLKTGSLLKVTGKVKNRKYQDAEGNDRWIHEVIVHNYEEVPHNQQ